MYNFLTSRPSKDFFDDFFNTMPPHRSSAMRTDIYETDKEYILSVELPGCKKEDVKISLKDGYLTIETTRKSTSEEGNKLIHREIFYGSQSRSYYVGNIDQSLVNARFSDGVLMVGVPKEEMAIEDKTNYIAIQ